MKNVKFVIAVVTVVMQMFGPMAYAADVAQGTMNISGNVPVIFSLTTRGIPGDLDLTPNVTVVDRLIGILHLKYNVNVASLNMTSDTTNGVPASGGTDYNFGTAFTLKFQACTTVEATYEAAFNISTVATDIADAATAGALTTGIEEDCNLTASWGGTAAVLPLAGKYSMTITFTMTSI